MYIRILGNDREYNTKHDSNLKVSNDGFFTIESLGNLKKTFYKKDYRKRAVRNTIVSYQPL